MLVCCAVPSEATLELSAHAKAVVELASSSDSNPGMSRVNLSRVACICIYLPAHMSVFLCIFHDWLRVCLSVGMCDRKHACVVYECESVLYMHENVLGPKRSMHETQMTARSG